MYSPALTSIINNTVCAQASGLADFVLLTHLGNERTTPTQSHRQTAWRLKKDPKFFCQFRVLLSSVIINTVHKQVLLLLLCYEY